MSKTYTDRLETSLVKAIELPEPKQDAEVMETYDEAKGKIEEREVAKQVVVEMVNVESSNIRSMGHDAKTSQLRVLFTNGGLFQYKDVPVTVYNEMMESPSTGSYFSKNVRTTYKCVKLN